MDSATLLAPLLAPVAPDRPAGDDLSFAPEVDAIQEMRREDDSTLDQGEWVAALKSADWPGVARSCEAILATRSKDLQIAGWLADAWARLRGFDGLADGLDLVAGLIDLHWKELHPLQEGDDAQQRAGNLRWLSTRVEQLAPTIPLVTHDGRSSTLADIGAARARRLAEDSSSHGGSSQERTVAMTGTAPTLDAVWRDVTAGGSAAAGERRARVDRSRAALARLQAGVDDRLGEDAPSFVAPRAALDRALEELERLARECGVDESGPDATTSDHATTSTAAQLATLDAPGPRNSRATGRITTRAQALEQLRAVSTFFRTTEPHSPVAYLADKAARWSEMPLHEWLRTVVKDGGSLAHLEELLGIEKASRP